MEEVHKDNEFRLIRELYVFFAVNCNIIIKYKPIKMHLS